MSDTALVFNILAKDKASSVFGKISAGAAVAGVAIGAALTTGLMGAFEQGKAESKLAGQLGSPELAAEYGRIAGSMYTQNFGESVAANMSAVKDVMSSGLLSQEATSGEIESITSKAQALADTFDQEVTPMARAAGQMVRNGLAKDGAEALDVITLLFQQTGDHAGDALDTLSEYSVQFAKLGLDGATAAAMLAQGLMGGARDVDTVADTLKEFSIRSIDGSKASAAGFAALGLDATKMGKQIAGGGEGASKGLQTVLDKLRAMKDPVAQQAAAVALFGTKAEDMGAALLSLNPATASLGDVAGAADELVKNTGASPQATLETFGRKAQQGLVDVMAKAIPYIMDLVGWLVKNKDVIIPIAEALGIMAVVIGTIVAVTKIYTAVQIALNVAMMANPIGLIILAVIALIAIFFVLWTHSAGFRDFFIDMWGKIWGFIKGVGHWFANDFVNAFKNAGQWIKDAFWTAMLWIHDKIQWVIDRVIGIKDRVTSAASGMWDGIKNAFKSVLNWIFGKWNSIHLTLPQVDLGPLGKWGGFTLQVPQIPMLASGGTIDRAGMAVVGERGPERVWLPSGATVEPNGGGRAGAGGGSYELGSDGGREGDALLWAIRRAVRGKGGDPSVLGIRSLARSSA